MSTAIVYMQYYTAELFLYQICLLNLIDRRGGAGAAITIPWSPWRVELLCAGIISARAILGFWLNLPLDHDRHMSNSQWVQVGFALTISAKLAIASKSNQAPREASRLADTLNMSVTFEQAGQRMEALSGPDVDSMGNKDVFHRLIERRALTQNWYEGEMEKIRQSQGQGLSNPAALMPDASYNTQMPLPPYSFLELPSDYFGPATDPSAVDLSNFTVEPDMYDESAQAGGSENLEASWPPQYHFQPPYPQ